MPLDVNDFDATPLGAEHPDIDTTYGILRLWAQSGVTRTYNQLSQAYEAVTGVSLSPYGTWDDTLGAMNRRLDRAGLPPLSGIIVLQNARRPGAGFWGCCARTSMPLPDRAAREGEYFKILKEISAAAWPIALP